LECSIGKIEEKFLYGLFYNENTGNFPFNSTSFFAPARRIEANNSVILISDPTKDVSASQMRYDRWGPGSLILAND
jgi:hypothetical protein